MIMSRSERIKDANLFQIIASHMNLFTYLLDSVVYSTVNYHMGARSQSVSLFLSKFVIFLLYPLPLSSLPLSYSLPIIKRFSQANPDF